MRRLAQEQQLQRVRGAASLAAKHVISIQSHVVYGAAGNSAAVFPMQRMGINVWPINTVQFSNHTQYGQWEGLPTPMEQISLLVDGIGRLDGGEVLRSCNAVLSGYLGSPEQGEHVLEVVRKVREANPQALYICDPVMGHPAKGCVVPQGVQDHHANASAAAANVVCPNVLELGVMAGTEPGSPAEVLQAARRLLDKGPSLVLVKHLAHAGLDPAAAFEMLLVSRTEAWHIATPLLPFSRPPVGVGDLTSGLFLAGLLHGKTPRAALEHTAAAYLHAQSELEPPTASAVMEATSAADQYELQLVTAQDGIASPNRRFEARPLPE